MKTYYIYILDSDGFSLVNRREFDTMRDARQWVRETGLDRDYWVRRAESDSFPAQIDTIQLRNGKGEVLQDWFPEF